MDAITNVTYFGEYRVEFAMNRSIRICYRDYEEDNEGLFWKSTNPIANYSPFYNMEISIMIVLISLLHTILKPLQQPRFVAEVIAGIMIGPSLFGNTEWCQTYIHPVKTYKVIETMANLGMTYYMLLIGMDMDLVTLKSTNKIGLQNALVGILLPIGVGAGSYWMLVHGNSPLAGLFWSITLTVTSFPDLVQVLSDLKLLHTEIGKIALSLALINHVVALPLLVFFMVLHTNYYILFSSIAFLLFCFFLLRPAIDWAIAKTSSDGGRYNDVQVYFTLIAVLLFGFTSEVVGIHNLLGAYVFGLIIPKGEFGAMITDKIEDFVNIIVLPIYFMITGNRIVLRLMIMKTGVWSFMAILALACSAKFISTFVVTVIHGMSLRDGITLGALMNTKGILALIILNSGRTGKIIDGQTFSAMTLAILLMTSLVKPIIFATNKFTKPVKKYHCKGKPALKTIPNGSEFRVLVGVHSSRNLSGIIKLLQLANPSEQSPIQVFSAHLVELTERSTTTAMLVFNESLDPNNQNIPRQKAESCHINNVFEKYAVEADNAVSSQPLTVIVSPYNTMHEDICSLISDNNIDMTFMLYGENACLRQVNCNILANAWSSIGVLVDRGISSSKSSKPSGEYHFAMLFIGGPDDREGLAYAYRMAGSHGVKLTVLRFLSNTKASNKENEGGVSIEEEKLEGVIDDEYINDFLGKTMNNELITFMETRISTAEQIIITIGALFNDYDLIIVGRGENVASPLTSGLRLSRLSEWKNESEELGSLADTLIASEFAKQTSILVVQQYYVSSIQTR